MDKVKNTGFAPAQKAARPRPAAEAQNAAPAAEQSGQKQTAGSAYNSFFGDSLLFRYVAKAQVGLVPELAELGAWAAGADARDKARAIHIFPPRFIGAAAGAGAGEAAGANEAAQLAVHPAYHGLLTRARHAGLAAMAPEENEARGFARRARACRLYLLSQADCAPLQDMAHSAAAAYALAGNPQLKTALSPLLANRIHDPSRRFFTEKHSIALGFAGNAGAADCRAAPLAAGAEPAARAAFAAMLKTPAESLLFYRIGGECRAALSPLSDGFIIRAAAAQTAAGSAAAARLFFVPAFKAPGQSNGVEFIPLPGAAALAAPCCGLRFNGSLALPLSAPEQTAAAALLQARDALLSDYAAMAAGLQRAALAGAVAKLRRRGGNGKNGPAGAAYAQAERALADAALDAAAAQILALRLAAAEDKAADNPREAAFAAVMRPALVYELWQSMPQFTHAVACLSGETLFGQAENALANRLLLPDFYAEYEEEGAAGGGFALLARLRHNLRRHGAEFFAAMEDLLAGLPAAMAPGAGQVLHLAARRCNEEAGAAFFLAERLVYSAAAALFYAQECGAVAAAYTESRLGGARQSGYGSLSLRHNAGFILEALYPQH